MTTDIYSPDERPFLAAWFSGRSLTLEEEGLLEAQGFDHACCEAYTLLDAWVGAFAVRDIQARLPNCGIGKSDGSFVLTRPIDRGRRSKKVAGLARFLFRINWADSGPGMSWPADYHLVWLPGFERFVLTYSADSPDAFGYCDFALGSVGAADDWRAAVREMLVNDWRAQFATWDQSPWAYLLDTGLVSEDEAMQWRREAWKGHEEFAADVEEQAVEDDEEVLP